MCLVADFCNFLYDIPFLAEYEPWKCIALNQ